MKKFSRLVEGYETKKYFKIKSELNLAIEADNDGEASYISDLTLSSIDGQSGYTIQSIEETTKEEYDELMIESLRTIKELQKKIELL